ncbi:MAG: hypothetical protein ACRD34_14155 [Bryobacteraceae bacterium]
MARALCERADGALKDLTRFFHQGRADVLLCAGCTLLVRNEYENPPSEAYSDDDYDAASHRARNAPA